MKDSLRLFPYLFVIFLRIITPFFIWKNVVLVLILSSFLDLIDSEFFRLAINSWKSLSSDSQKGRTYKKIDKILDFYWYVFILVYMRASPLFLIFAFLFLLRLIGMFVYFITKYKKTFIFFPNLFETLFIVFVIVLIYPVFGFLLQGSNIYLTILGLIPFKLLQEYICCIEKPNLGYLFKRK
ncbi:MAG: hypothetical protein ISS87_01325 [Candidatus Pacebacteria bacterium]|nr:hypothetical protein [Candidatus Paceibacterota bacterium]